MTTADVFALEINRSFTGVGIVWAAVSLFVGIALGLRKRKGQRIAQAAVVLSVISALVFAVKVWPRYRDWEAYRSAGSRILKIDECRVSADRLYKKTRQCQFDCSGTLIWDWCPSGCGAGKRAERGTFPQSAHVAFRCSE